jgi:uncharacterized membrane protein
MGPLPPPEVLAHFEQVHPGLAGIIVDEFRANSAHTRGMEQTAIHSDFIEGILARLTVLFLPLAGLGTAVLSLYQGAPGWVTATVATAALAAPLVGAILRSRERQPEKARQGPQR